MQKSVLNKQGKFGVKILWRYTDMAIFVLRCFILTHPVYAHILYCFPDIGLARYWSKISNFSCSSCIIKYCRNFTSMFDMNKLMLRATE